MASVFVANVLNEYQMRVDFLKHIIEYVSKLPSRETDL